VARAISRSHQRGRGSIGDDGRDRCRIRRRAVGHPRVRHARGKQKYTGSLSYASDDMGTLWRNVGFNRIEASVSGPIKVPDVLGLGHAHRAEVGRHGEGPRPGPPDFRRGRRRHGVDAARTWAPIQRTPSRSRSRASSSTALLRQLRSRRRAGERRHDGAGDSEQLPAWSARGCGCRSRRAGSTPATPSCNTLRSGSRVALSGNASSSLTRNQPLTQLYNPSAYTGTMLTSYAGT